MFETRGKKEAELQIVLFDLIAADRVATKCSYVFNYLNR